MRFLFQSCFPLCLQPGGPGATEGKGRSLCLAFDKTYLLRGIDVVELRWGRGYIGTAVKLSALNDPRGEDQHKGFLPLKPASEASVAQEDANELNYAAEMCEFLLWNPAVEKVPRLSLQCVPMLYQVSALEMAELVGRTMLSAGFCVKTLVFDNATTHTVVKAILLGVKPTITEDERLGLTFWREIVYQAFPCSSLPRWPFRKPLIGRDGGEVLLLVVSLTCSTC